MICADLLASRWSGYLWTLPGSSGLRRSLSPCGLRASTLAGFRGLPVRRSCWPHRRGGYQSSGLTFHRLTPSFVSLGRAPGDLGRLVWMIRGPTLSAATVVSMNVRGGCRFNPVPVSSGSAPVSCNGRGAMLRALVYSNGWPFSLSFSPSLSTRSPRCLAMSGIALSTLTGVACIAGRSLLRRIRGRASPALAPPLPWPRLRCAHWLSPGCGV